MGSTQEAAPERAEVGSSNPWFVVAFVIVVLACAGWLLRFRRRRAEAAEPLNKEE
jgi:LPXTG-motif cell wall-anchored protein